jgi:hypothetical protein
VDCAEYKRLVSKHPKAIGEWKISFDDARAWARATKAERAIINIAKSTHVRQKAGNASALKT